MIPLLSLVEELPFPSQQWDVIELFQLPFMQRAIVGGTLTGILGGLVGSLTILRELSFFSDALANSVLLGVSLGLLFGLNSSGIFIPFAVIFAIGIAYLLKRTQLWTDAILNIVYSSSLALGIIILTFAQEYQSGFNELLFGEILMIRPSDLLLSSLVLIACIIFISLTWRTQLLLIVYEPLAVARGISVSIHQTLFIVLLSLAIAISINAVGVLLVSAFVVIPAAAARLMSSSFIHYIFLSAGLGTVCAVLGVFFSAVFNLPSGPTIVATQLGIFLSAIAFSQVRLLTS